VDLVPLFDGVNSSGENLVAVMAIHFLMYALL
jgi:hypothetical protein